MSRDEKVQAALRPFAGTANNPLKPSTTLLIKLGSMVVHYEEMLSTGGHTFDKHALDTLTHDAEVKEWFAEMNKMAFLPVKRSAKPRKP